jgi:hypothetical protein
MKTFGVMEDCNNCWVSLGLRLPIEVVGRDPGDLYDTDIWNVLGGRLNEINNRSFLLCVDSFCGNCENSWVLFSPMV